MSDFKIIRGRIDDLDGIEKMLENWPGWQIATSWKYRDRQGTPLFRTSEGVTISQPLQMVAIVLWRPR